MATPVGSARVKAYTGAANTLSGNVAPGSVVTVSHSSATTLTLPESTSVLWEPGTVLFIVQTGAGAVTLAKTGSDTIVPATSNTTNAGDTLILTKTSSTGWHCAVAAAA